VELWPQLVQQGKRAGTQIGRSVAAGHGREVGATAGVAEPDQRSCSGETHCRLSVHESTAEGLARPFGGPTRGPTQRLGGLSALDGCLPRGETGTEQTDGVDVAMFDQKTGGEKPHRFDVVAERRLQGSSASTVEVPAQGFHQVEAHLGVLLAGQSRSQARGDAKLAQGTRCGNAYPRM